MGNGERVKLEESLKVTFFFFFFHTGTVEREFCSFQFQSRTVLNFQHCCIIVESEDST